VIGAVKSSRRTAAARIHSVGESTGAAGPFPANGFNTSLTRFTTCDTAPLGVVGTVTATTGVAVCIVISALDVTSPLVAVDEDDSVESGVAARPANTRGLDSQVVTDGAFTTTSLAAMVLLGSTFSDTAVGEDAGLAITLADIDDSPPVINVVRGVASSPLVSPVLCGEVGVR
jgi:hypothetical protein